jgi:hypothetical protein
MKLLPRYKTSTQVWNFYPGMKLLPKYETSTQAWNLCPGAKLPDLINKWETDLNLRCLRQYICIQLSLHLCTYVNLQICMYIRHLCTRKKLPFLVSLRGEEANWTCMLQRSWLDWKLCPGTNSVRATCKSRLALKWEQWEKKWGHCGLESRKSGHERKTAPPPGW